MASYLSFVVVLLSCTLTTVFAQDYTGPALKAHNEVRSKHQNTGPLKLSKDLNSKAAKCAKRNANRGSLEHDCPEQEGYGENLAMGSGYKSCTQAVQDAVRMWYEEKKDYDYNNPGFSSKTGHFTQVVWKNSAQLGCGCVKSSKGYWTSCLYSPPGNFNDDYKENVLPEK